MIKTTLVKTPTGAKSITELKAGDLVCNEFGKPVAVRQVVAKGREPVVDILVSGRTWVTCTKESRWLVKEPCGPKQAIMEIKKVSEFTPSNRVLAVMEGRPFGFGFSVAIGADEGREEETFGIDVDSETNLYQLDNGLVAHS